MRSMACFLALLIPAGAMASTPPGLVNYEGVLRDSANAPLDGDFDMAFHFFDAPTGGSELLVDTHSGGNAVEVNGGLFNVLLGSGTISDGSGTGTFTSLAQVFILKSTVYLEVRVDGETLSPRVQIVSAAYGIDDVVYNVRSFGAKADGTDDREEIQAAINAATASGGGIVFFPCGTYVVGQSGSSAFALDLSGADNVELVGSGDCSVIKLADVGNATVRPISAGVPTASPRTNNIALRHFKIDGNKAGQSVPSPLDPRANVFLADVDGLTIDDVTSVNADGPGVYLYRQCITAATPSGDCVVAEAIGVNDARIINNRLIDNDAQGVLFTGCTNCVIEGNFIKGGTTCIKDEAPNGSLFNIAIANNICTNAANGIAVQGRLQTQASSIAARNVAIMGNVVQDTVPGVNQGDGILIAEIQGVTIVGNTLHRTSHRAIAVENGASNVTIADNTIVDTLGENNQNISGTDRDAGICVFTNGSAAAKRIVISGNSIQSRKVRGIVVNGSDTSLAEDVVVTGNVLRDDGVIGDDAVHWQIWLRNVRSVTVAGNQLSQNGEHYWVIAGEDDEQDNSDFTVTDNSFRDDDGTLPNEQALELDVVGGGTTALTNLVFSDNEMIGFQTRTHVNDTNKVDGSIEYHGNIGGVAVDMGLHRVQGGLLLHACSNVASASSVTVNVCSVVTFTGTTPISTINTCNAANKGRVLHILCGADVSELATGGNLSLSSTFTCNTAGSTLSLLCSGATNWSELARTEL